MLRVNEVEELFDAAATLARMSPQRGARLAIVTNGGGAGVLATDRLMEEGGELASPTPARSLNSTPCCRRTGVMAIRST
jgi:acyl-CoA synthetase (NDP forming)